MELKKLEDIEIKRPKGIELPYLDWFKEALRKEAIKHYKHEVNKEIHTGPTEVFEWIEDFFNLTKEDLE